MGSGIQGRVELVVEFPESQVEKYLPDLGPSSPAATNLKILVNAVQDMIV